MTISKFSARELFHSFESGEEFILLDVRDEEDYTEFNIEGPNEVVSINIPYVEFMDNEIMSVLNVPEKPVKVICAKEGSSRFVASILDNHQRTGISYLEGGITSWGDVLIPKKISSDSDSFELWQFIRPGKASCSYALICNQEMYVFDPTRDAEFYQTFAEDKNTKITHVFETHLQADYISGGATLSELVGAKYVVNESDFNSATFAYHSLQHGELFSLGENGASVLSLHSPGHTPGSTTYIIDERFMISGDTVFIVSIGRPDLGGKVVEWSKQLYATLKERITVLPEELIVLPGHFSSWKTEMDSEGRICTNFGNVLKNNDEIYGIDNEDEFVEYIKSHMRKQPDIYDEIRQVNNGLIVPCEDTMKTMDLGKNECSASKEISN